MRFVTFRVITLRRHQAATPRHDPASALAAYPINGIVAALDLIRAGRTAMAIAVRESVPQEIYDSMCEVCCRRDWDELQA